MVTILLHRIMNSEKKLDQYKSDSQPLVRKGVFKNLQIHV